MSVRMNEVEVLNDSLENILSDFDDALGVSHGLKTSRKLPNEEVSRTLPRVLDNVSITKRLQNGYASDYTGYYSGGSTAERRPESATMHTPRQFALDFNAPPKPPHRSTPTGRSTPSRHPSSETPPRWRTSHDNAGIWR
ncbi:hypothetical protein GCK32_015920 [Trichostrongylus colubriformis]|uniref:Uncharacterized protein n=1 Tax=Trichostrongylus colubriformis TaxID=6319 RepID=A0AAN8F119_TRICO